MSEKLQDRGRKMAETMAVVSYKVLPKCNALYSVSVNVTTRKVSVLVTTADARVYVLRSKNSSNRPCKVIIYSSNVFRKHLLRMQVIRDF
uniref:Uncharacterized protein n=1 Tax=Parascaris equorum TaxID=6256 RepID=A0A914RZW7_PAREQ